MTAGKAVLEAARGPASTTPAIRLDNGQNTQVATAALMLGTPADLSAAQEFGVFIRQNSNLKREPGWSIRLRSGPKDYFERVFPVDEIVESGGKWCQDRSSPGEWATTGSPSWARITAVDMLVPAYAGAGAGNVVAYATFSVYP